MNISEVITIEVLPKERLATLMGRSWGNPILPSSEQPLWFQPMPATQQLRFLASGPKFDIPNHSEDLINSEKLFAQTEDLNDNSKRFAVPKTLEAADSAWYLLVGDKDFTNIAVTEGPFHELAHWIHKISHNPGEIALYFAPKHPDQVQSKTSN